MPVNNSQILAGTGVVFTTPAGDSDALVVEPLGEGMSSYIKNTDDVKQARALFARLREYLIEAGVCSEADECFAKATAAVRDLVDLRDTKLYYVQEGMEHRIIWKDAAGEEHDIYKNTEH